MDTKTPKTPVTLPFAGWQAMSPATAAREVHGRIAPLPAAFRRAALAWVRPENELAHALEKRSTPDFPAAGDGAHAVNRPFRGLPYLLKDLFDLAGVPTMAGSTFLSLVRPLPTKNSRFPERVQQLGAACAGKSQLVEFASGLTGENPHYGDCPHPFFPGRLSGGSSSGSAALVAAGVVPFALGTDTGGSVRVPAAFCGLHGFRGTPGHEWITDAFPLSPTMDTAGWFTANATDMLTTWRDLVGGTEAPAGRRGCHLPMKALLDGADDETSRACDAAAAAICPAADRATHDALLNAWQGATDAYVTIGMSEAHAVHREWLTSYRANYDPVIWQRFHDAGHYPAEQILRARAKLEEIRAAWRQFFSTHDFLILPATPCPAPRKVDCTIELRRSIIALTAPASLGGLPVLSIPVPLPSGMSAGLQIIVPSANSAVIPWILGG